MDRLEQGRERGRLAARQRGMTLRREMNAAFRWLADLYPTTRLLDIPALLRAYDQERLACEPDYHHFPEMRGLIDRHIGERDGFRSESGAEETAIAFHFSWDFFVWRRINASHAAYWETLPLHKQCTNIFFPEGSEGVTIADNRDVSMLAVLRKKMKTWHPSPVPARHRVGFRQGVVSNGVPLDEDPVCSFPCNPFELMPPEAYADIRVAIEFMSRYREFWGPGNMLWCDRQRNAVAVEKTNCRVAFRFPVVAGAVGVTACAYLDPELHAFKQKCLRKVMKAKRESQRNNMDWHFDQGSRLRYQRLMNLTQREAARPGGATLWGAFDIVADEAVPFPARICLAGQKVMPDQPGREQHVNWTVSQHAGVITGPRRRWLCRAIRDTAHPRAVTRWTPRLVLGEGVRMRREWQADITAERCELAGKEGTP